MVAPNLQLLMLPYKNGQKRLGYYTLYPQLTILKVMVKPSALSRQ